MLSSYMLKHLMFEETNKSIQLIIYVFNIRTNIVYQLSQNARDGNFIHVVMII